MSSLSISAASHAYRTMLGLRTSKSLETLIHLVVKKTVEHHREDVAGKEERSRSATGTMAAGILPEALCKAAGE